MKTQTDSIEWSCESLRITFFLKSPFLDNSRDLWETIVGEPPENIQQNPKQQMSRENGNYENGELIISALPFRIDIIYTSQSLRPQIASLPVIYSLGDIDNSINTFNNLTRKILSIEPFRVTNFPRIALGMILNKDVKSRSEGYQLISSLLPFNIDSENSSDFLYQINRPREQIISKQTIIINRLSKWSVSLTKGLIINADGSIPSSEPDIFSARLELDINTVPNNELSFDVKSVENIYLTLVNFGIEITKKGDIK